MRSPLKNWFKHRDKRADQMRQMMDILGVDPIEAFSQGHEGSAMRPCISTCMQCRAAEFCGIWLNGACRDVDYHSFCPNASRFDAFVNVAA